MIHTPNSSILPCGRAVHKINVEYPVTTSLATLHCIRRTILLLKHDLYDPYEAMNSARDGKAQRRRFTHARNWR